MDIRDMKYVCTIAEQHTLSDAGRVLYITQPALSKFLKLCEGSLGLSLFSRTGNQYTLTPEGEVIYQKAKHILALKEELDRDVELLRKRRDATYTLAMFPTRSAVVMPVIYQEQVTFFSDTTIRLREEDIYDLVPLLLSREIDYFLASRHSITVSPAQESSLVMETVGTYEYCLAMSSTCPLAKQTVRRKGFKYRWLDISLLQGERIFADQRMVGRVRTILGMEAKKLDIIPCPANLLMTLDLVSRGVSNLCFVTDDWFKGTLANLHRNLQLFSFGNAPCKFQTVLGYREEDGRLPFTTFLGETIRKRYAEIK